MIRPFLNVADLTSTLYSEGSMKTQLRLLLAACCFLIPSCSETNESTLVVTKVSYSHPAQLSGGHEITQRQAIGTISDTIPSTMQGLTLKNKEQVILLSEQMPQTLNITE